MELCNTRWIVLVALLLNAAPAQADGRGKAPARRRAAPASDAVVLPDVGTSLERLPPTASGTERPPGAGPIGPGSGLMTTGSPTSTVVLPPVETTLDRLPGTAFGGERPLDAAPLPPSSEVSPTRVPRGWPGVPLFPEVPAGADQPLGVIVPSLDEGYDTLRFTGPR